MPALNTIVNKAVDAFTGGKSSTGTTLQDFLENFSPSDGRYISTIDTRLTFDVTFEFYPKVWVPDVPKKKKLGEAMQSALGSLKDSGISAAKNALNNVTGGLLGSILNNNKPGIIEQHDTCSFSLYDNSFMCYLAPANLLGGDGSGMTTNLQLNLGFYIQSITVPQLKMQDGGKSSTLVGDYSLNGSFVTPDNNNLIMSIINTKAPLIERIFYPWMKEATLPYWSYDSQPYTTAKITIDFTKHSDIKYVFYGCRPCLMEAYQPTQEASTQITRDVTFLFDYMAIHSNLKTMDDVSSSLLKAGKTLFNSASNMLNAKF
jgi:hypothetical protein